jgi:hypothetical protein
VQHTSCLLDEVAFIQVVDTHPQNGCLG